MNLFDEYEKNPSSVDFTGSYMKCTRSIYLTKLLVNSTTKSYCSNKYQTFFKFNKYVLRLVMKIF